MGTHAVLRGGPCGMDQLLEQCLESCSLWKAHVRSAGEERHPLRGDLEGRRQAAGGHCLGAASWSSARLQGFLEGGHRGAAPASSAA